MSRFKTPRNDHYWSNSTTHRALFDKVAEKLGIHPQDWPTVYGKGITKVVQHEPGGRAVLSQYGSLSKGYQMVHI